MHTVHFLCISGTENNCLCHGVPVRRQKCAALYVVPPPAGHHVGSHMAHLTGAKDSTGSGVVVS